MGGRGRFKQGAVCPSGKAGATAVSLGRLMNFAKRVCIREPEPSGASSRAVTASAKLAAHASKCATPRSFSRAGAR